MATVRDFLSSSFDNSRSRQQYSTWEDWAAGGGLDEGRVVGGGSNRAFLEGLGITDPMANLDAAVPDPLAGNMFKDSVGGLSVLALPFLAAAGGAAFGGAGVATDTLGAIGAGTEAGGGFGAAAGGAVAGGEAALDTYMGGAAAGGLSPAAETAAGGGFVDSALSAFKSIPPGTGTAVQALTGGFDGADSSWTINSGLPSGVGINEAAGADAAREATGMLDKLPDPNYGTGTDSGILEKVLKYGPLALGPLGILAQKAQSSKIAEQIAQIGGPQRAIGEKLIGQYESGTLHASDKYQIDNWERSAIAQMKQFYANAGISTSTQQRSAEQDIKSHAQAMRSQALQNILKTGLEALNVTDKYLLAALEAQYKADAQVTQSAISFMGAYGAWLRALPVLTGKP